MVSLYKRGTALDKEKKINPGIRETAEAIVDLFTEDQLSILDITVNDEKFEFLERIVLFYGDMHPAYEIEEIKVKAKEIIDQHSDRLQELVDSNIYEFIKKFNTLFVNKKSNKSK